MAQVVVAGGAAGTGAGAGVVGQTQEDGVHDAWVVGAPPAQACSVAAPGAGCWVQAWLVVPEEFFPVRVVSGRVTEWALFQYINLAPLEFVSLTLLSANTLRARRYFCVLHPIPGALVQTLAVVHAGAGGAPVQPGVGQTQAFRGTESLGGVGGGATHASDWTDCGEREILARQRNGNYQALTNYFRKVVALPVITFFA